MTWGLLITLLEAFIAWHSKSRLTEYTLQILLEICSEHDLLIFLQFSLHSCTWEGVNFCCCEKKIRSWWRAAFSKLAFLAKLWASKMYLHDRKYLERKYFLFVKNPVYNILLWFICPVFFTSNVNDSKKLEELKTGMELSNWRPFLKKSLWLQSRSAL